MIMRRLISTPSITGKTPSSILS